MKSSRLFKWKNFRNHVSEICKINYTWDRFTDMTFIVQKRRVTAHKIILSANSEFFKKILSEAPSYVHTTITLPDVNYEDLDAIMKFIYTGELLVHPERLDSVLSLASCLQVKSLMKVQAALIKENEASETADSKMGDIPNILPSSSQEQPKLRPPDISDSKSQDQPELKPSDVLHCKPLDQPEPESSQSHISDSRLQVQPEQELLQISNSESQEQTKMAVTHKKQLTSSQKIQKKNKSKEHFKNLVANERVGQTSSSAPAGELKKNKGKKCGGSKSDITIAGKSNGLAVAPKSKTGRSNHRCIKEKLLREFERGGTIKEVCKLYNISPSSAFYYKKCFVKAGKLSPSMINYQKKRLGANTKNKKVAENIPQTSSLRAEATKGDRISRKK